MKQELKQSEECSTRLTREIQKLKLEVEKQKQKNKEEVEKTKKYDKIAKELINIAGYEFDD
jgi:NAD dependent epimerase/dehydratase family enzyme